MVVLFRVVRAMFFKPVAREVCLCVCVCVRVFSFFSIIISLCFNVFFFSLVTGLVGRSEVDGIHYYL